MGRAATIFGSCILSVPAVAFRGLMNVFSPAAARRAFIALNSSRSMNASPRTSIAGGIFPFPLSTRGIERIVRRLLVISSPCVPSPRVAPWTSAPSRYFSAMATPSNFSSAT